MLRRVSLIITFLLGICVAVPAGAQQPAKIPRIGFLCAMAGPSSHTEMFQQGLRELGYVEGKTIAVEYRFSDGASDRFTELAAELIRLQVDLVVVASAAAIRPTKEATQTIPIVMAQSEDPVKSGFVASLGRPGGNITGLSSMAPEASAKQLELLREVVPKASRIAVLWNAANPDATHQVREVERRARALGVKLLSFGVRGSKDFDSAFAAMSKARADGLVVMPDLLFFDYKKRLVEFAAKTRLPVIYGDYEFAEAGGLIAYGPSTDDLFRRSAAFVDKILKGAKPADLPVQQPTQFELVINLKTAKALGLAIPPPVLLRADALIQ